MHGLLSFVVAFNLCVNRVRSRSSYPVECVRGGGMYGTETAGAIFSVSFILKLFFSLSFPWDFV